MRLRTDFGLDRPLTTVQRASARPGDYLRSGSHLHQALGLRPPSPERSLFPGILGLALAGVALIRMDRRTGLFLAVGFAIDHTTIQLEPEGFEERGVCA